MFPKLIIMFTLMTSCFAPVEQKNEFSLVKSKDSGATQETLLFPDHVAKIYNKIQRLDIDESDVASFYGLYENFDRAIDVAPWQIPYARNIGLSNELPNQQTLPKKKYLIWYQTKVFVNFTKSQQFRPYFTNNFLCQTGDWTCGFYPNDPSFYVGKIDGKRLRFVLTKRDNSPKIYVTIFKQGDELRGIQAIGTHVDRKLYLPFIIDGVQVELIGFFPWSSPDAEQEKIQGLMGLIGGLAILTDSANQQVKKSYFKLISEGMDSQAPLGPEVYEKYVGFQDGSQVEPFVLKIKNMILSKDPHQVLNHIRFPVSTERLSDGNTVKMGRQQFEAQFNRYIQLGLQKRVSNWFVKPLTYDRGKVFVGINEIGINRNFKIIWFKFRPRGYEPDLSISEAFRRHLDYWVKTK